jgi:hypothetical protein
MKTDYAMPCSVAERNNSARRAYTSAVRGLLHDPMPLARSPKYGEFCQRGISA